MSSAVQRRAHAWLHVVGLVLAGVLPLLSGGPSSQVAAIEPLFAKYGTGTLLHPIKEPDEIRLPAGYEESSGQYLKQHVHIFAINGLNPMCLGNFNGLCVYLRKQGFENIRFGQLHSSFTFASEIRALRQKDVESRIVVVGYSFGANYARSIVNDLARDGVRVDLLVYLGGDHIPNTQASYPDTVSRVLNVRSHGLVVTGGDLFFNGEELARARNVLLDTRHILIPSRQETLTVMMEELLATAYFSRESEELPAGRRDDSAGDVSGQSNAVPIYPMTAFP